MANTKVLNTMAAYDLDVARELIATAKSKIKAERITDEKEQKRLLKSEQSKALSAVIINLEDEQGAYTELYEYNPEEETREEFVQRMKDVCSNLAISQKDINNYDIKNPVVQEAIEDYKIESTIEAEVSLDNMSLSDDEELEFEEVKDEDLAAQEYEEAINADFEDENEEYNAEFEEAEEKAEKSHFKLMAATAGVVALVGLGALLASCHKQEAQQPQEETTIETSIEDENVVNEVQDSWIYNYDEGLTNQNEALADLKEDEIADEDIELMESLGYTVDPTNKTAYFAFDAREGLAANLRFVNYDKEDIARIMGGEQIDVANYMSSSNSLSNNFMSDVSNLLVILVNENTVSNLNIKNLFPDLSEDNLQEFTKFQDELNNYANLLAEGKEDEAKEAMATLKSDLLEYGMSPNEDGNTFKPFVLRTVGTAASTLSVIYDYHQDIELTVFDSNTGEYVDKEIKGAQLFDEVTMRNLVLGWTDCSVETINGQEVTTTSATIYGLSDNYKIVMDEEYAVADRFNSDEEGKFTDYNNWIAELRLENSASDSSFLGSYLQGTTVTYVGGQVFGADEATTDYITSYLNTNTEYDRLTLGTVNIEDAMETIYNTHVEAGIAPSNMPYYEVVYIAKMHMARYAATDTFKEGETTFVNESVNPQNLTVEQRAAAQQAYEQYYLKTYGKDLIDKADEAAYVAGQTAQVAADVQTRVDNYNATHTDSQQTVEAVGTQSQLADQGIYVDPGKLDGDGSSYSTEVGTEEHKITYEGPNGEITDGGTYITGQEGLSDGQKQDIINNAPIYLDDEFKDAVIEDGPVAPVPSVDNTTQENSSVTPAAPSTPAAGGGEFTSYDPTIDSPGFAPVVEAPVVEAVPDVVSMTADQIIADLTSMEATDSLSDSGYSM